MYTKMHSETSQDFPTVAQNWYFAILIAIFSLAFCIVWWDLRLSGAKKPPNVSERGQWFVTWYVLFPISAEDDPNAELERQVRSILNKLTPQKFDKLVKQFNELKIDSERKLANSIELIFEKVSFSRF